MRNRPFVLASRAASHRHAPTWSESLLWRELAGEKLGVAFKRQVEAIIVKRGALIARLAT